MNNFNETTQNTKKKFIGTKTLVAILMVVILLLGFAGGYYFYYFTKVDVVTNSELMQIIRENGIDARKDGDGKFLSDDEEAKIIVDTLLADDLYRKYYTKEEYQKYLSEGDGNYVGIGVSFIEDTTVYRVIGNSPAMKAGIIAGDVIKEGCKVVNGAEQYTSFANLDALQEFLKTLGEGDKAKFKVERNGAMLIEPLTVIKSEYVASYVTYVDNQEMITVMEDQDENFKHTGKSNPSLDNKTAYIALTQFQGDAAEQFINALNYAKEKGRKKLIIDLCDNGGGKLSVLTKIASYLLYNKNKSQTIIAIEESRSAQTNEIRHSYTDSVTSSNNYDKENIEKIVVLANNNTASASECLLLAMLYYGSADFDNNFNEAQNVVIVEGSLGARTYGKGKMQTTYKLKSGAAIKLTTANLYAPDGETSINGTGITTTAENVVSSQQMAISRAIELMTA